MHHPRPHNHLQVRMLEISLFAAGLMASVFLFGCSPETAGTDTTGTAKPAPNLTADVKSPIKPGTDAGKSDKNDVSKAPLPGETFKISGYSVLKADDLLSAATNPFLNKAPIVVEAAPTSSEPNGDANTPVAPPADPYAGITLTGILYNPHNPVALMSVGEDVDGGRQLLKKGDTFYNNGQGFKVVNMTKSRVDIKQSSGGNVRTLYLPEIIGYGKGGSTESVSSAPTEDKQSVKDMSDSLKQKLEQITETTKLKEGESNKSILKLDEP